MDRSGDDPGAPTVVPIADAPKVSNRGGQTARSEWQNMKLRVYKELPKCKGRGKGTRSSNGGDMMSNYPCSERPSPTCRTW